MRLRIGGYVYTEHDAEIIGSYMKDFLQIQEEKNKDEDFQPMLLINTLRSEHEAYEKLDNYKKKVVDSFKKSMDAYGDGCFVHMLPTILISAFAIICLCLDPDNWYKVGVIGCISFLFTLDLEYVLSHHNLKILKKAIGKYVFNEAEKSI